jgi:hypothetical protein
MSAETKTSIYQNEYIKPDGVSFTPLKISTDGPNNKMVIMITTAPIISVCGSKVLFQSTQNNASIRNNTNLDFVFSIV